MKISITGFVLALALCVGVQAADMRDSANWEGSYEADDSPTNSGWIVWNTPTASVSGGVLTFSGLWGGYKRDNMPGAASGMSIEYRIRLTAGPATGTSMYSDIRNAYPSAGFGNGNSGFRLMGFGTSATAARMNRGGNYVDANVDNSVFHTYRCVFTSTSMAMYVDENTTPVGTFDGGIAGSSPPNSIDMIIYNAAAEVEVDYVRWTTTGAFEPPPPPDMRDSANWEGSYEADDSPTNCGWVVVNTPTESVSGGVLTFSNLWGGYRLVNMPGATPGMSIEYRIKLTAGPGPGATAIYSDIANAYPSAGFGNGISGFRLAGFGASATAARMNRGGNYVDANVDNSVFHTYRCVFTPTTMAMYLDGNTTPVGTFDGGISGHTPPNHLDMVIYNAAAVTEVDYVRWTTTGGFEPLPPPPLAGTLIVVQ